MTKKFTLFAVALLFSGAVVAQEQEEKKGFFSDLKFNGYVGGSFDNTWGKFNNNGEKGFSNLPIDMPSPPYPPGTPGTLAYSKSSQGYMKVSGGVIYGFGVEKALKKGWSTELMYYRQNSDLKMTANGSGTLTFTPNDPGLSSYTTTSSSNLTATGPQDNNFILLGITKSWTCKKHEKLSYFAGYMAGMNILGVYKDSNGDVILTANGSATDFNGDSHQIVNEPLNSSHLPDLNNPGETISFYNGTVRFASGIRLGANYQLTEKLGVKIQGGYMHTWNIYNAHAVTMLLDSPLNVRISSIDHLLPGIFQWNLMGAVTYNLDFSKKK